MLDKMNNNTIIDVHMINNKGFIWKADGKII